MRKTTITILIPLLTLALGACAATTHPAPEADAPMELVAVVDGIPVKKTEFKQELDSAYRRLDRAGQFIDGTMYEQLKSEVVESLINLILLDQYRQTTKIQVDEAQVEQLYQKAVARYPSKSKFTKSLEEAGLTELDLRTRLRRTLSAQKVVEKVVAPTIEVNDKELKTYYDENADEFEHGVQVHAAHILIQLKPFAEADLRQKAKQRIEAVQKKIAAGEDFAALAKKYSEGPSKVNGGDLGYFETGQMTPAFETAAFSLQPGDVSGVVTTRFGLHLIKVYDRIPAGKTSFAEAAPGLKTRFFQERLDERLRQLVDQLKSKAEIERFPLE